MAPRKPIIEWTAVIVATASMLLSAYSNYNHTDKENASRLTALETHQVADNQRLDHIQNQVDKLVEWALGKK